MIAKNAPTHNDKKIVQEHMKSRTLFFLEGKYEEADIVGLGYPGC